MKIVAIIPTLGERPELQPLRKQLESEGVETIIINRPEIRNIHILWNDGAHQALTREADYLAILNDDITLPDATLTSLQTAMTAQDFACAGVDPNAPFGLPAELKIKETTGEVGELMIGVTTWCFMVKASAWVDIDERYQWWWGVGDLFTNIQACGGKLGQLCGLGIRHVGSGTASKHQWTEIAKHQDSKLWRELH